MIYLYSCLHIHKASNSNFVIVFILYLLSLLLVLTANTLPMRIGSRESVALVAIVLLVLATICVLWLKTGVPVHFLQWWVLWYVLLCGIYTVIGFTGGVLGDRKITLAFLLLALFPLFLKLLMLNGRISQFFRAYVNVVTVVASISLVIWLLGPVVGVLHTNCSIENSWTGNDFTVSSSGYFGLEYLTQRVNLGNGLLVWRNTSFFTEAPMYSLVLSVAVIFEIFFSKKPRVPVLALLSAAILTTMSTAGIVATLFAWLYWVLNNASNRSKEFRTIVSLAFVLLVLAVAIVTQQLIDAKFNTSSGSIRLDDLQAGFKAWSRNFIVGNGFSATDIVQSYMSGFRSYNIGFSNTLFDILAKGGIVYFLAFLIPALGFLNGFPRERIGFLVFLFVWVVTISTNLPIALIPFAYGFVLLVTEREGCTAETAFVKNGDAV